MIFNNEPKSWRELQNMVGRLFSECSFETRVSSKTTLVRGRKEVDVYAIDKLSEYEPIILIECKQWNKKVNQETVHAFRTVMADHGGNLGFIVSKVGFQSGAFEAVEKTNIRLVTLHELEVEYYSRWMAEMFKRYLPIADILYPYWDPVGGKMPQKNATKFSWDMSQRVHSAYLPLCSIGPWDIGKTFSRKFPLDVPLINDELDIIGTLSIKNDREFFDFAEANKDKALRHFKILYGEIA
jgi:hypothetical protein